MQSFPTWSLLLWKDKLNSWPCLQNSQYMCLKWAHFEQTRLCPKFSAKTGCHLKIIGKQGPLQAPFHFKTGQNKGLHNGICSQFGAFSFCRGNRKVSNICFRFRTCILNIVIGRPLFTLESPPAPWRSICPTIKFKVP